MDYRLQIYVIMVVIYAILFVANVLCKTSNKYRRKDGTFLMASIFFLFVSFTIAIREVFVLGYVFAILSLVADLIMKQIWKKRES